MEQFLDKVFSEYGLAMALCMVAAFYFYKEKSRLDTDKDKLQQDKLDLTKALGDVTNVANRHIEASNEFMKELPQVFAAAIVASQDKVIAEVREMFRSQK